MNKFVENIGLIAPMALGILMIGLMFGLLFQKDNFYQSLKTNKDCLSIMLIVDGKAQTAYQCKNRLYFKLDNKTVEITQG